MSQCQAPSLKPNPISVVDSFDNERIVYEDLDEDDSWRVEQDFKHETDDRYHKYVEGDTLFILIL